MKDLSEQTVFFEDLGGSAPDRRVVVTGGAGFLGSNLCERLIASGASVTCIDNLETGALENIEHLLPCTNFNFILHDVTDPLPIAGRVDEIYNLACPASPPKYQIDPIRTFWTSILGARNVLDLALKTGAVVLQASTSEVYGDPEISPQSESYRGSVNTFGPRACYDEGKRAAETLFYDYANQHGVKIRVVRIFNTYGPRMDPDDGRVVTNFINQALRGEPLTIYGTGEQTRSFCYVDDLLDGIEGVMGLPDAIVGPINVGNPTEFTMLELADLVLDKTGSTAGIEFHTLPVDDPKQRRPDLKQIIERTGWRPTTALNEGLDRTIAYFAACEVAPVARKVDA